jgi:glucoamylase
LDADLARGGYLILHGPVTAQERWEENAGYSPSTLARSSRPGLRGGICARPKGKNRGDFLLAYADWLSSRLEEWMVTDRGELVKGKPRHYVRITPPFRNKPMERPIPTRL